MKLDRNINPDGRGKYALINLRNNTVCWGGDDQFFVIKYKDMFASAALHAYAIAAKHKAITLEAMAKEPAFRSWKAEKRKLLKQAKSLREYATEIYEEAERARSWPGQKIPD